MRLAGPTADSGPWLAAADVVAVPSRWEAMALVVLEAMAVRRSVVASDVGAARECLRAGRGSPRARRRRRPSSAAALVARLHDPGRAAAEEGGRPPRRRGALRRRRTTAAVRSVYAELLEPGAGA